MTQTTANDHLGQRVRHERKYRLLEVRRVTRLTPKMVRVTLAGGDLAGFVSAAHDDHVKVFFPRPGEGKPALPVSSPNGPVYPEGVERPPSRDYTPRRYDKTAGELAIDFILHGDGPASIWAEAAKPGQFLGVGGPRGSFVAADDFDFHLFVGDETALPAIARRLEEMPANARAKVILEVADRNEQQRLESAAEVETIWLSREGAQAGTTDRLDKAVADLALPQGDVYAWVAAESATAKRLRRLLIEQHGLRKDWIKAASYWTRGTAAAGHETFKD